MHATKRIGSLITPEKVLGFQTVQKLALGEAAQSTLLASHFGSLIIKSGETPLTVSRLEFKFHPAREFFKALKVARCHSLTMTRVPMGNEEIAPLFPLFLKIVMNHPFIEELSLHQCALHNEHAAMIANKLKSSNLNKLDLSCNFIEEPGAIQLGHSIGKLNELNLSKNKLDERISRILRSHPGCNIIIEE